MVHIYVRIVPRGGGAYTRPRIIQISLPRPLVISIRRRRRITLSSCARRGAAGDTIYIIRSPLSLTRAISLFPPPYLSLTHSSQRPRIRDARAHDSFDIICIYASAAKYIYYILCTYIIIENPSCNPFSRTHTHIHTHFYIRTYSYIHLPALTVLHGVCIYYIADVPLYIYTYAAHLHRATIDFSYIIYITYIHYVYILYTHIAAYIYIIYTSILYI